MGAVIDRDRVRAAVAASERRTSAEIVVAIAPFFVGSVERAAHRAFERLGVADTRDRNGVLVFVVPRRKQVFVVPDLAAEQRLGAATWEEAARTIAAGFREGHATDGLVAAVTALGDALAGGFPPRSGDVDELPGVITAPR